jgi:hypothetical protein
VKVASYKFALLRALGETASTSIRLAHWMKDDRVMIPLEPLIEKWVEYYWPLLYTKDGRQIYQGQNTKNKNDLAFRPELTALIDHWENKEDGWRKFKAALLRGTFTPTEKALYKAARSKIRTAMINGPVFYMGNEKTRGDAGNKVFRKYGDSISVPAELWTEFSLMGRWFEDSLMLRWAEFCASSEANKKQGISESLILSQMLSMKEVLRNVGLSKSIYKKIGEKTDLYCVWSDQKLKDYDLDHAIPYSLWRNNALWNLFPANKKVNNDKRDKLPERSFLTSREKRIREYWDRCYETEPQLFNRELLTLSGTSNYNTQTSGELFRLFCEQMEILALQNVVERWKV